jgi:hypothetical protein
VNILGVLMAIVIASAPPPTSADWSITPTSGPAVSAPGSSGNPLLMPGDSSTSGYLITHTDAIDGPLDISATSSDPATSFEDDLLVTVAVNGVAGQTRTLGSMLQDSSVARATNALPAGPVVLTVKIELDPTATSVQRLRTVDFDLFVTVSDEVVQLPMQPSDPGAPVPPLAPTGQALSVAALVLGGSLTGFGVVLILRRRRGKPDRDIVQGAD